MSKQMKSLTLRGTKYEIVDEQARNTIAGAYRDIRRDCAAAIEQTAAGPVIKVDDSSNNPFINLRLFGKTTQFTTKGNQLADFANGNASDGITATFSDDTLTIVGDGSALYQHYRTDITSVYVNNPGSVLYFTCESIDSTNTIDGQLVQLNVEKSSGTWKYTAICNKDGIATPYTIPADVSDVTRVNVSIYTTNSATASANTITIVKPMLQFGTSSLDYEPYTGAVASPNPSYPQDLESVAEDGDLEIRVHGANLCNLPDMESYSNNGIYWKYSNGAIVANGTASAQSYVPPSTCTLDLIPGTYTVSGGVDNVSVIVTRKRDGVSAWFTSSNGSSATFDVEEGDILYLYGQVPNGKTVVNVVVYPVITAGTTPMPYESYSEQILTASIQNRVAGVPVTSGGNYTDANGQQWICDEIDFERGVHIQRVGMTRFAGLEWAQNSSGKYFCNSDRGIYSNQHAPICTHMVGGLSSSGNKSDIIFINANQDIRLNITLDNDTVEGVASAMNDAVLYGALAAPIETALTDEQITAYKTLCTNYPNTTIVNDSCAFMEVTYNMDLAAYALSLVTDARIQSAVNNWLNANYAIAEEASF